MKKKMSELPFEEQERIRKYNREQKQKSREKQKVELRAKSLADADDWSWDWAKNFPQQNAELTIYTREFSAKVYEELGRGEFRCDSPENETFAWVTVALFCLRKNSSPWVREVENPDGVLVGGLFYPDALGSDLVANTHRFGLETSSTYSAVYRELLRILDKKFGHEETEHAHDVKIELEGEYVLKLPEPISQPKPEPIKTPEVPSIPSALEILERGRIQLLNQLHPQSVLDPNL